MGARERFSLDGKVAIVTGSSRGIGQGIAWGLAEHGVDVAVVDMATREASQATLDGIRANNRQTWFFQQDLGRTDQLAELAERIWNETGRIDILVNNAGVGFLDHFNEITLQRWRHVMAVNTDAVFFLSQQIAERMIASGIQGSIINTSSVNGLVAEAGLAHYNASKGAVELITKTLAIELGQHGINVNSVCPGMIDTEIDDNFDLASGFESYFRQHIPLGHRIGTVEDCVGAVIFFASPAGKYVTGQQLVVDGGVICEQVPRLQFMPPYKPTLV